MKIKITAFVAAWLAFVSTQAFGQSGLKISGRVIAADGKGLDGATIYLVRAADSALVKAALANTDGIFELINLKKGDFKININMIGFSAYKSSAIALEVKDVTLPTIMLQQSGTSLKEVNVNSTKPFIEHRIDRTVLNVDALNANAGSTAIEVLERAPGVMVDQNGGISLNGKSVQIFIDDKPTYLSGADLESYLRSINSSNMDQVELMTNPPARYDAAGNGGVINIKTRRTKIAGFNGTVNLAYAQGKYGRANNGFNFNYRKNKLNLTGNLAYNTNDGFTDLNINRIFNNNSGNITSIFVQENFIRRWAKNLNARFGVDYYLSDKTTIGLGLNGLLNPSHRPTINTSTFFNPQNKLDSTIIANNRDDMDFDNLGLNLNYRHTYNTKGQELTFDADYLKYYSNNVQSFLNTSYPATGGVTDMDLLTGSLPAYLNIYTAKADYAQQFKSGFKLSAGLKTAYTATDNTANYFYTKSGITQPDYGKTNHFLYRENINAAYINLDKDYKRLSIQAGLRLEQTLSNGHQLGNAQKPDSSFNNNYTSLFPTIYLQYKLDSAGKHSLSLNYGRRVDRPYFQDLNPFQSPLDKFTYYVGNPFLKAAFSDNVEVNYGYKGLNTGVSYSITNNQVDESIEIVKGVYYSRPGNFGKVQVITWVIDYSLDIGKWLNVNAFTRVQNIHTVSQFYTGTLNSSGTYFFGRSNLTFKPGKDWTVQVSGGYQSPLVSGQFKINEKHRFDASVAKKISAAFTAKLALSDLFYTWANGGTINNLANTKANWNSMSDSRFATLSVSYRFGKAIQGQRQHEANGADSEQSRVKN